QLTPEGFGKLFHCYKDGVTRLEKIFRQEILHLEAIDTKGRRAKGVITTKVTDLKSKIPKTKKKNTHLSNESHAESSMQARTTETIVSPTTSSELKIKRHRPSKEEKEVLETL